jgi:two-component system response regulator RegX3
VQSHILIVDDDPFIAKMIDFLLTEAGYTSATLADPRHVLPFLADHAVDLVLLDVMMPHIDGFTLGTELRRQFPDLPLIFLTARGQIGDKVAGFMQGADDYLAKPFEPTELLARIAAVLRRYRRADQHRFGAEVRVGEARLNLGALQFVAPGREPVVLTPTEMKVLECLMCNANATMTPEALNERVWGYDAEGDGNRVAVFIRRLRAKIEADPAVPRYIRTVRGVGYTFRDGQRGEKGAVVATA